MPDSTTAHTAFPADTLDPVVVRAALLDLVETLGRRLRGRGQIARALTLTVRLANGSTVTRTRALDRPSGHTEDLRTTALQLLERYGFQRARLRRLRLTCEDLRPAEDGPGTQLSLAAPVRNAHRSATLRGTAPTPRACAHSFRMSSVARCGGGAGGSSRHSHGEPVSAWPGEDPRIWSGAARGA